MKVPLPDTAGKERPEKESLMNEKQERMMDLRMKGYCCSQIVMQMGLDHLGKENPDLIATSAGRCDGMYSGKTCGTERRGRERHAPQPLLGQEGKEAPSAPFPGGGDKSQEDAWMDEAVDRAYQQTPERASFD